MRAVELDYGLAEALRAEIARDGNWGDPATLRGILYQHLVDRITSAAIETHLEDREQTKRERTWNETEKKGGGS